MLLKGIEPPEIGTVRDRVMTRMFSMEQAKKLEEMSTFGSLIAVANKADKTVMNNIKSVLDHYKDTTGYNTWSNLKKTKKVEKKQTEAELLAKVAKLT